jgi:peptidoglycan/xylan/chitin deacetylase (PgdA/CDA1 family)
MYHYVRDFKHSRYPDIKGIDISLFREQIIYLKKHYKFITMEMLIDAIDNNTSLPEKSVLLTFDDAYIEHFNLVFPLLDELKIQGSFYPPVKAITEHTVLDVNKIHFILASEENKLKIITEIKHELNSFRKDYNLESDSFYYSKLGHPSRYDTADVIFIKRLLQVELEETLRKTITNNLFEKIVGIPEDSFSRELYMDIDQIKCMQRNGMHIGSHGYDHYWLGSLTRENQKKEIEKSLAFLNQIGCDTKQWTMCYPYGNYNDVTIELLKEYNCKLALTTEVNIADIQKYNKHTLPRLDTNDIPKDREAVTNDWYLKG